MDKIVSTVSFEGEIYIFTERGRILRMRRDGMGKIVFERVAELPVLS
jgi:hypothetical protein